jgi:hypothetical protein
VAVALAEAVELAMAPLAALVVAVVLVERRFIWPLAR